MNKRGIITGLKAANVTVGIISLALAAVVKALTWRDERREVAELKEDNAMLKQAADYFASEAKARAQVAADLRKKCEAMGPKK